MPTRHPSAPPGPADGQRGIRQCPHAPSNNNISTYDTAT